MKLLSRSSRDSHLEIDERAVSDLLLRLGQELLHKLGLGDHADGAHALHVLLEPPAPSVELLLA